MFLQALRREVSHPRTSVQLCLLGIVAGLCAASIIIVFRLSFEYIQIIVLGGVAQYSSVEPLQRFLLPVGAIVLVLLVAKLTGFKHYRLGIPFVIHRVKTRYGHIPLRTTINQFFGGIFSLAGGFVVGKEGPTVHLAAAGSHFLGQWCRLPFNSLRILTGCGIAAGIAAAFNTPFAAVIFVMEVVLRQYRVHIFVPVMLAAACGSVLTRLVFGNENELTFLTFSDFDSFLLLYLVFFGFCLGLLAALFNRQLMLVLRLTRKMNMIYRLLLAGAITGAVGFMFPQALGAEFAAMETVLSSNPSLQFLLMLFVLKFVLAIMAIGLGVPGGIIGAVMIIGMLAGVILLQPLYFLNINSDMSASFALLGLAGMLAAVLHAPMAALSSVMELSANSQVIMPAIIVIVAAYVTSKQLCNNCSIFVQQLDFQNLPYTTSSIRDVLQETGVMALMKDEFKHFVDAPKEALYQYLQNHPQDLVLQEKVFEIDRQYHFVSLDVSLQDGIFPLSIELMEGLSDQSTMAEVYETLHKQRHGAVYIYEELDYDAHVFQHGKPKVVGMITWNMLHGYLLRQQH
ncbi:chloride channel protein [Glaciecola sp. MH2013]|uniref:chloride channel protein n=1 Tax=Glaciecola sp. MH2013 TaxID=2785524 RepID=UPI00189D8E2B|nr:chloride channel protein [Glaciecola sp. MH2013]MBF7073811.1 chloride channel protein [Glaciecola sp. MH2013]